MFGRVRGLPCPAPHQIRRPPRLVFARYQHLPRRPRTALPPPPPAARQPGRHVWARPRSALSGTPSDPPPAATRLRSVSTPPSPPAHRPSASAACRPPTRPPCLGASAVLPCPASFSFELRPPRRVFVGLVRAASSLEPGPLLSGVPLQASVHAPLRSSLHWCGAVLASPRLCPACSCFRLQPLGRVFVSSGSVWLRMLLTPIWSCTPSRPLALRDSALLHGRCAAVCSVCSRGARVKCRICSQPGPLYAPRSRQYVNQPGSSAYAASQDLYSLQAVIMHRLLCPVPPACRRRMYACEGSLASMARSVASVWAPSRVASSPSRASPSCTVCDCTDACCLNAPQMIHIHNVDTHIHSCCLARALESCTPRRGMNGVAHHLPQAKWG